MKLSGQTRSDQTQPVLARSYQSNSAVYFSHDAPTISLSLGSQTANVRCVGADPEPFDLPPRCRQPAKTNNSSCVYDIDSDIKLTILVNGVSYAPSNKQGCLFGASLRDNVATDFQVTINMLQFHLLNCSTQVVLEIDVTGIYRQ